MRPPSGEAWPCATASGGRGELELGPPHITQAKRPVPLLQWTATSTGSWNLTRFEVLGSWVLRPGRSGWLRRRIDGGHFLSPSWGEGGEQREAGGSELP